MARALAALTALGLAGSACGPAQQLEPAARPVIVIFVDTLRADHLGMYGYERETSPRLDALARDGVVFEHAFATASWTLPSASSLLTGQWPTVHGAGALRGADARRQFTKIRATVPTLAELVGDAGYANGAVVNVGFMAPRFGLARGFDEYDWVPSTDDDNRRAGESVDRALAWIDARDDDRFLLLLHLFDPHRHFDAPPPVRGMFTEAFRDRYGDTLATLESRRLAEDRGDLEFHIAAYDEEIAYVDLQAGRFVDGLRERGLWNRSLVMLTADHGESLHDHGERGHGGTLYNELIRVPLVVWSPEVEPGRRVEPVSLVDVVPTVLDWADVAAPAELPGVSLLPLAAGAEAPAERLIAAELSNTGRELRAVIRWPHKLIFDPGGEGRLLFDLSSDPGELHDLLSGPDPATEEIASGLRRLLRIERRRARGEAVELDEETLRELRALGYIQ